MNKKVKTEDMCLGFDTDEFRECRTRSVRRDGASERNSKALGPPKNQRFFGEK